MAPPLSTYIVVDSPADPNDVGRYLRAEATYTDRRGPNKTASYVALNLVQATRDADNTAPEFSAAQRCQKDNGSNEQRRGPGKGYGRRPRRHTDLLDRG